MIAINDKIIVKPEKTEETTRNRIILPITRQHSNLRGTIVSCGPLALSCHDGDYVCYDKMMGMPVNFNGEEFVLMREGDIIAILKSQTNE